MPATARRPVPAVAGQFELMLGRPPAADGQLDLVAAANEALDAPRVDPRDLIRDRVGEANCPRPWECINGRHFH